MPLYLKLFHDALMTEIGTIAPVILVLLVFGILVAIFQSSLQIEDATLNLLAKALVMIAMIVVGGGWALDGFEGLAAFWIGHAAFLVRRPWS